MVWAVDSNAYVCTAVIPNGPDETESVDLGGAYYTANLPVVEKQLAKAGYRYVFFNLFYFVMGWYGRDCKGIC